jgi:hypothetical protein
MIRSVAIARQCQVAPVPDETNCVSLCRMIAESVPPSHKNKYRVSTYPPYGNDTLALVRVGRFESIKNSDLPDIRILPRVCM